MLSKSLLPLSLFLFFSFFYFRKTHVTSLYEHINKKFFEKPDTCIKSNGEASLYFNEKEFQKYLTESVTESSAILPGTRWCGKKFTALSYNDLGKLKNIDSCCRKHDLCANYIEPKSSKCGLNNTTPLIKMHCECDANFYKCLKNAKNLLAISLGYAYFQVLNKTCFNKTYPIVGCAKKERGRCVRYNFNYTLDMKYQWFDNPKF